MKTTKSIFNAEPVSQVLSEQTNKEAEISVSENVQSEVPQVDYGLVGNEHHRFAEKIKKIGAIIIGVFFVIGVAYGGWWGYDSYIANTPDKVLKRTVEAFNNIKSVTNEMELEIVAKIDQESIDDELLSILGDLRDESTYRISFGMKGDYDMNEEDNLKSNVNLNFYGGTAIGSLNADIMSMMPMIYFKINRIPLMASMFLDTSSIKDKWISYELDENMIEDMVDKPSENTEIIKKIIREDGGKIFRLIANNGIEDFDGYKVYHYTLGIDKEGFLEVLQKIKMKLDANKQKSIDEFVEESDEEFWGKFEKFSFEIFIDKKDYYVRKVEASFDLDNSLFGLSQTRSRSRDAKRIADIKQIQTALELYFIDNDSYPVNSGELHLGSGEASMLCAGIGFSGNDADCPIKYMSAVPTNPTPGGSDYVYESLNNGMDYRISFSLEDSTGGFEPGTLEASPNSIEQVTVGKPENTEEENGVGVTGNFVFISSNFNQPMSIEAPPESKDLEELINKMMGGVMGGIFGGSLYDSEATLNDAKQISDIKQLQTALESFYVDHNNYPIEPNGILLGDNGLRVICGDTGFVYDRDECDSTVYMGIVPTSPWMSYIYESEDGSDYKIQFFLKKGTGSFVAGELEANPNGIVQISMDENTPESMNDEDMDVDTDGDGLSDREEKYIWFSDPDLVDTDGDGYDDGVEVEAGYDPIIPGSARLDDRDF